MCGRFVAATDPEGLVRLFVVDERQADVPPSFNVAPTDPVAAVVEHEERRHLVSFRWGLVPHWASSRNVAARMINARRETLASKPAFRDALARRRCLIPADGFYEWQRQDGRRLPWFVHPPEGEPVAFAGLWAVWRDPHDRDAPPLRTCTIITGPAQGRIRALHNRMPVVLQPDAWDRWLDRSVTTPAAAEEVLHSAEPPDWRLRRVPTLVNSVANNGPDLLVALDDAVGVDEDAPASSR